MLWPDEEDEWTRLLLNEDVDDDEGADWFICRDSEWFWFIEPGLERKIDLCWFWLELAIDETEEFKDRGAGETGWLGWGVLTNELLILTLGFRVLKRTPAI